MLARQADRVELTQAGLPPDDAGRLIDRLAQDLRSRGRLSGADLERAVSAAGDTGNRLDQALVELGLLTQSELQSTLFALGVPELAVDAYPDFDAVPQIARTFWLQSRTAPMELTDAQIILGMVDPFDDFSAQAIALKLRRSVRRVQLDSARFDAWMAGSDDGSANLDGLVVTAMPATARAGDIQMLREAATDAPVVRFVQALLRDAVDRGASDIHLRPTRAGGGDVLFRISGELLQSGSTPTDMLASIISRLKILADLDISERRRPQDGRLTANIAGRPIDVRMSTMPQVEGEGAVLRLLSREDGVTSLSQLGFSKRIAFGLDQLYSAANGLILVTGPTGSGKTTTQHSALRELIRPGVNVVTIEDPVEYRLNGTSQIQVDEKVGLTFPVVLRSLLRQDPDIIFVGEIRDGETARIAVQAALTGHLVLATLHTNSAPDAVPRLIDMGVEPYLLAAVLRGVLSQRLLRKPCPDCGIARQPPPGSKAASWLDVGVGCAACSGNGHLGRTAVGELLLLDAELTGFLCRAGLSAAETLAMLAQRDYASLDDDILAAADAHRVASSDALAARHG